MMKLTSEGKLETTLRARLRKSVNLLLMDSDDEEFVKDSEDVGTFGRQLDEDLMKHFEDAGSFGTQSVSSTSTPSINPCTTTIQLMQPSSSTGPTLVIIYQLFS